MIVGTAGHIDHGKTSLIRALTGVDTDRLPEEKRRGITIDLGFAPLDLPGIGVVGVVDVPGHDAFVRTMVAGATGVDVALLVVAADAGVMPQTREHLTILEMLGVHHGVVALTKIDLVEEEWSALVREDLRDTLRNTRFQSAPIVPVSVITGQGLEELRQELSAAAASIETRSAEDLFRLPIDRAFTIRGTGTVVTGTVWSGRAARDDTLRLMPADVLVRVRGVQLHGHAVDRVVAGDRAALALAGIDLHVVQRGAVLLQGEGWRSSRVLRAHVTLLDTPSATLGPRTRVRFHLGTSERAARLVGAILESNAESSVRIVLDEPIVARAGDRFVLRSSSPATTIGGGVIVDPHAAVRARPWPLAAVTPVDRLALVLEEAGAAGIQVRDLPIRLGVSPSNVATLVAGAGAWQVEGRLLASKARDSLAMAARAAVADFHRTHPLDPGVPIQWLRSRLATSDGVAAAVVSSLVREGTLVVEHGVVRAATFTFMLSPTEVEQRDLLRATIARAGREPPTLDEVAALLGAPNSVLASLARMLEREGALIAVDEGRYYDPEVVRELLARLRETMTTRADYAAGELREALGMSRKYLIPFLEYCDRQGYTIRDATGRRRRGT